MKKLRVLFMTLLLAIMSLTILHISNLPTHIHHESKAVLVFDDWNSNSQMDDEEKQTFHFHLDILLAHVLSITIILLIIYTRNLKNKLIFLTPKLHQSNYVIPAPKL
ncbi:hypothetical protein ACWM35_15490 [Neobacillus sp. K501]